MQGWVSDIPSSCSKSSNPSCGWQRPWLSDRVADGYGSSERAISFSEKMQVFVQHVEHFPEELEEQIEKRRKQMESRQQEEMFQVAQDFEGVKSRRSKPCLLMSKTLRCANVISI
ncbi:unnamed protein product [Cladocopium goreaui]|uniref:Uncharacterized protein n=1 Tax=Cladocopium goreaui TaxID=2562237 RepID=A0A9P1CKH1_9DINO|nr:unnamed protein product [Cladocopium goreaui]|mmetsp:Transcript_48424/g.105587  ORF Transcript_48424/g.105587 Transcript_48424/m.105587 type:complete len:115 (+) Transcript_48424:42-386(+)